MEQLIKDPCERNREYDKNLSELSVGNADRKFMLSWLEHDRKQTAEAVLSAVREMVEKRKMPITEQECVERYGTGADEIQENGQIDTRWLEDNVVYNQALDQLLTQLQANNKDV
jgi:hypothetical protein